MNNKGGGKMEICPIKILLEWNLDSHQIQQAMVCPPRTRGLRDPTQLSMTQAHLGETETMRVLAAPIVLTVTYIQKYVSHKNINRKVQCVQENIMYL